MPCCICMCECAAGSKRIDRIKRRFIGFYEYKPTNYNASPTTKYPLIIFLHGLGERGNGTTELTRVAANAIPRYIRDGDPMTFTWNGKTETFLVLSPQLSPNYGWWLSWYIEEMVNYAKQNLRIDTNRIILTGLSLGGGGTWTYSAGTSADEPKNWRPSRRFAQPARPITGATLQAPSCLPGHFMQRMMALRRQVAQVRLPLPSTHVAAR